MIEAIFLHQGVLGSLGLVAYLVERNMYNRELLDFGLSWTQRIRGLSKWASREGSFRYIYDPA